MKELVRSSLVVSAIFLAAFFILKIFLGIYQTAFLTFFIFLIINTIYNENRKYGTEDEIPEARSGTLAINAALLAIGILFFILSTQKDFHGMARLIGWALIIMGLMSNLAGAHFFSKQKNISFWKVLSWLTVQPFLMILPVTPLLK